MLLSSLKNVALYKVMKISTSHSYDMDNLSTVANFINTPKTALNAKCQGSQFQNIILTLKCLKLAFVLPNLAFKCPKSGVWNAKKVGFMYYKMDPWTANNY